MEIQINVGSYEGKISGFRLQDSFQQVQTMYSFVSSIGSIKDLYRSGKYLFAGGYEEIVKVYDINRRKEVTLLEGHTGTVTRITGYQNFLFTGAEDGYVCVWKCKDWDLVKKIEVQQPIVDICIDDSGKVMMSVTKDNKIQLWDLLNMNRLGVKKFKFNIQKAHLIIKQNQDIFIIFQSDRKMYIIDGDTNKVIKTIDFENQITDSLLIDNENLIISDSIGQVHLIELNENEPKTILYFKAHNMRVKQIKQFVYEDKPYLSTISSDGEIKIWDILQYVSNQYDEINLQNKVKPILELKTLSRLTCLNINVQQKGEQIEQQENIEEQQQQQQQQQQKQQKKQNSQMKKKIIKKKNKIQNQEKLNNQKKKMSINLILK